MCCSSTSGGKLRVQTFYHLCLQFLHSYCFPIFDDASPTIPTDTIRFAVEILIVFVLPQFGQTGCCAAWTFTISANSLRTFSLFSFSIFSYDEKFSFADNKFLFASVNSAIDDLSKERNIIKKNPGKIDRKRLI